MLAFSHSNKTTQRPGIIAYFVTLISGSGISFLLATYWLNLTAAWIALLVGAIGSVLGFFLGENIGDAIVFSTFLCLLVIVFLNLGPEIAIIRSGIVPVAGGLCVGKLIYGIWKWIS